MATKAKPVTAWAVFDAKGDIRTASIRFWRKDSISAYEKFFNTNWNEIKKHGHTCRKIQIAEVEK